MPMSRKPKDENIYAALIVDFMPFVPTDRAKGHGWTLNPDALAEQAEQHGRLLVGDRERLHAELLTNLLRLH
jgi:hypothetical protein